MGTLKFDELLVLNGQKLNKKYIQSLSKQERLDLIDPIFQIIRDNGFIYMDDEAAILKSWEKLKKHQPDINSNELFNNSSLATDICKYFCHKFYLATEVGKPTMLDNFNDDKKLKKIIQNRLGLDWLDHDGKGPGVNEAFNLSFKMIAFQGQRSMRMVNATSMFKPDIAKFMYMKYSKEGETVYDPSSGWGGRMLGAASCGRKYIGTDPWTTDELQNMSNHLKLKDVKLIDDGSENVRLDENSIDFSFSSIPYLEQETYVLDNRQAANNGEDHFYNVYWKGTLNNLQYMLKPGKVFGLNILAKYDKVVDMAREQFGEPFEIIKLRTIKSHLGKNLSKGDEGITKFEPIYMFKNEK